MKKEFDEPEGYVKVSMRIFTSSIHIKFENMAYIYLSIYLSIHLSIYIYIYTHTFFIIFLQVRGRPSMHSRGGAGGGAHLGPCGRRCMGSCPGARTSLPGAQTERVGVLSSRPGDFSFPGILRGPNWTHRHASAAASLALAWG